MEHRNRIWILGADNREMREIYALLRTSGEDVAFAAVGGQRVSPANRNRADALMDDTGYLWHPGMFFGHGHLAVYHVGCDFPLGWADHVIDPQQPGNPGFGRPPEEYFTASSIGQVIILLAKLGNLKRWHKDNVPTTGMQRGETFRFWHNDHDPGTLHLVVDVAEGETGGDWGADPASSRRIPAKYSLMAAAAHCLDAAYRGECPGIDPNRLRKFIAARRKKPQDSGPIVSNFFQGDVEL